MVALAAGWLGAAPSVHAQTSPGALVRTVPDLEPEPGKRARVAVPPAAPARAAGVGGTFVLGAVAIDGATALDAAALAPSFEPYLAAKVGQAELDKIAAAITQRYRQRGYLLSYATVPKQSVRSGIVRLRVVEGYVDKVRIEGDRRSAAAITELVERLSVERPLRNATLERALGLVREVPGVMLKDTRITRSPADPARHQLTIIVGANRVRALAYGDNRGTIEGARARSYTSFSLASLAIPGDQLQLDLFSIPSKDFRFVYGQAKASIPLTADGLRASTAISRSRQFQRLSGQDQRGNSRQLVAEMTYPLEKSRAFSLIGRASLGDWKSEERRAGRTVRRDRIQVARAGFDFMLVSKARLDGRVSVSRGLDLGAATEAGDPLASRPRGSGKFSKVAAQLQVTAKLSKRLYLRADSAAQYSSRPLLAPEEFALGGSRIGRAFDFNEATGDHGIGVMLELSYRLEPSKQGHTLEFFAFGDGGSAYRKRPAPGLADKQSLASTGVGARAAVAGVLVAGEIGVPLASSHGNSGIRAFVSVAKAF